MSNTAMERTEALAKRLGEGWQAVHGAAEGPQAFHQQSGFWVTQFDAFKDQNGDPQHDYRASFTAQTFPTTRMGLKFETCESDPKSAVYAVIAKIEGFAKQIAEQIECAKRATQEFK